MKKLIFAVLSFILVACSNQSIEDGLDDLNARLVELEQEIVAFDAQSLLSDISEIADQVAAFEAQNEENQATIADVMATLDSLNLQLAEINEAIEAAGTMEQIQAIKVKLQEVNEGIALLVFASDYDLDGIINGLDQCPNTPITEISLIDTNGCGPSEID